MHFGTLVLLNRYDMSKSPDAYVERTIEALMETSENLTETTRKQGKFMNLFYK